MTGEEPGAKRQKNSKYGHELGIDMVDIVVGPLKQHFRVHKELLCSRVPYFQKMFEGGFKEGAEQAATLPEDDPDAFALFLEWLYTGACEPIDEYDYPEESDLFANRVRLYCMAEKMLAKDLMDYTITSICSNLNDQNTIISREAMILAYNHSALKSRIRDLMTDFIYCAISSPMYSPKLSTEHMAETMVMIPALAYDVVHLLREIGTKPGRGPHDEPMCFYHVHTPAANCPYQSADLQGKKEDERFWKVRTRSTLEL